MSDSEKIHIFVSYKHNPDDEKILDELMQYIHYDATQAGAEFWFDKKIKWGTFWDADIRKHMEKAHIALVLVSQLYLSSDYIVKVEIDGFVEKRKIDGLIILPLILSDCNWGTREWLAQTQFLPKNGKNVEEHYQGGVRKALFKDVLSQLLDRINDIKSSM